MQHVFARNEEQLMFARNEEQLMFARNEEQLMFARNEEQFMLIDNTLANVLYSINESSCTQAFLDNEQTINLMLDLKAVLCQAHILSANDMHTPGMDVT